MLVLVGIVYFVGVPFWGGEYKSNAIIEWMYILSVRKSVWNADSYISGRRSFSYCCNSRSYCDKVNAKTMLEVIWKIKMGKKREI